MKLKEIVTAILDYARDYPNVHSVYQGDIYDNLNGGQEVEYTAVVVTQQQHNYAYQDGNIVFNFNVFYVDRLTADGSNALDTQSEAADFFYRLVDQIDQHGIIQDFTIQPFTERFADLCAGAYATFGVQVPVPCQVSSTMPTGFKYLASEDNLYIITEDGNYVIIR